MRPGSSTLTLFILWLSCQAINARHSRHQKALEGSVGRRQSLQQEPEQLSVRLGSPESELEAGPPQKIPNILHYIYLSGFDKFVEVTEEPKARLSKRFYDSCAQVHTHWEIKFWTEEMALDLIKEHFAWFLPIWYSYDMEVKRADAIRPFILYHYGGLYLDLDTECFEPAEKLFMDYDVVLQGSGWEGVNNGMMASAPGHPLWLKLAEVLKDRHTGSSTEAWRNRPLYMTGPWVLAEAVKQYLSQPTPISGFVNRVYNVDGTNMKVYALGEFYMPCWESDLVCMAQLEEGLAKRTWITSNLAGRHWFAGTWNKPHLLNVGKAKQTQ